MKPKTYNCDLAAKVILDLARLDRIGGIFRNHLVQVWFFVRNEEEAHCRTERFAHV